MQNRTGAAMLPAEVIEKIRHSEHQKVKIAVTDIDGVLRGKYLHKDKFLSAVESGFGFCNVIFGWDMHDVVYDNATHTGWHTGYPDDMARLDISTLRHVPWDGGVPFVLGEFVKSEAGEPSDVCPRQLLRRVIQKVADAGFSASVGVEFEWFNFLETAQSLRAKNFTQLETLTPGMFGYSLLRSSQNQPFFAALFDELGDFGIPIEGLHTETGPGVLEAAILYCDPLEAADRAVLFKSATKEIASRFGIVPTFMAKWHAQLPGCGGHLHQSLWRKGSSDNAFYDAKHPHRMSTTFQQYLAGQMHCLPDLLSFFAPTVNSYKRLVEGAWAPTKVTWGVDNRTAAFRAIPGSPKSTRLELRVGGADINPYLAIAAALASGLYGIEHQLKLPSAAIVGSAYQVKDAPSLSRNLHDATEKLAQSKIAREILHPAFVDHYVRTRQWEWRQFQQSVTNWELERYFEII